MNILFEPGRSVIGDCGLLVTQIQYIKESESKNFMIVDASMSELIRPPLYNAFHKITPILKRDNSHKKYDIVGPVCESADFLGKERSMNSEVYDLLVIEDVGAYGFVLSSNYNTIIFTDHNQLLSILSHYSVALFIFGQQTVSLYVICLKIN